MRWVITGRFKLMVLLALLTVGVGIGLPTAVEPDNSLRVWFVDDDPLIKEYDAFHAQFGNDEVMLLHISDETGVMQHRRLIQLQRLTTALESLDGVDRVHSVLTTRDAVHTEKGLTYQLAIP
ncbi:MAG: hypothetical protein VX589_02760, partial [Myxococcota bacterium]|nr:hypothetical protein [Myxococcota bacterium]